MYKITWDVQNNLNLYIWDAIMYKIIWPPPKVFLTACIPWEQSFALSFEP